MLFFTKLKKPAQLDCLKVAACEKHIGVFPTKFSDRKVNPSKSSLEPVNIVSYICAPPIFLVVAVVTLHTQSAYM